MLLAPALQRLGWDAAPGEAPSVECMRAEVLAAAIEAGDSSVAAEAQAHFASYFSVATPKPPASLRGFLLKQGVRSGGVPAFERVLAAFKVESDPSEAERLLRALASSSERSLVKRLLELALTDTVKTTDIDAIFTTAAHNQHVEDEADAAAKLTWAFLQSHWGAVLARIGDVTFMLPYLIGGTCDALTTRSAHDEVAAFFDSHAHVGAERRVKQTLDTIRDKVWQMELVRASAGIARATIDRLLLSS